MVIIITRATKVTSPAKISTVIRTGTRIKIAITRVVVLLRNIIAAVARPTKALQKINIEIRIEMTSLVIKTRAVVIVAAAYGPPSSKPRSCLALPCLAWILGEGRGWRVAIIVSFSIVAWAALRAYALAYTCVAPSRDMDIILHTCHEIH